MLQRHIKIRWKRQDLAKDIELINKDKKLKVSLQKSNNTLLEQMTSDNNIESGFHYMRVLQYLVEECFSDQDVSNEMLRLATDKIHTEWFSRICDITGENNDQIIERLSNFNLDSFSREIKFQDKDILKHPNIGGVILLIGYSAQVSSNKELIIFLSTRKHLLY